MDMKNWLSIAVLAGMFLVSSQHTAQAAPQDLSGFICQVSWNAPEVNSAGGRFGFLSGSLFTEPFCQGSMIDFFSLYSTGQTQDPQNHAFTQQQLLSMFQILQAQMVAGLRVNTFSLDTTSMFRGVSRVTVVHSSN
jgi:hypothetical protein